MNRGILKFLKRTMYKIKNINRYIPLYIIALLLFTAEIFAQDLTFSVHKKKSGVEGPTILIIGGIQGDEPGGFNAASLIVTNYKITKGNVWVVPNLNFISIVNRSRGVYGDLNRKFADLKKTDPEYGVILKIKSLIQHDDVDMVLNLHDGSGFFNPRYIDRHNNPNKWGHCVIIDQEKIANSKFGDLKGIADKVVERVNKSAKKPYYVHNTKTFEGNEEMAKTLTYFAINKNKAAFGVEASKNYLTPRRVFYHLHVIEEFFKYAGIEYERKFKLSYRQIKKTINSDIRVALNQRILLDMDGARKYLRYIPLKKGEQQEFRGSNPLIAVTSKGGQYRIIHGNRRLSYIYPQYFKYDHSIDRITVEVDGVKKVVKFGEVINITDTFKVIPEKEYRVNIIGFTKYNVDNEAGILVKKKDIAKRFSVDTGGNKYRVEVYRDNMFSGMILIDFSENLVAEEKDSNGVKKG